MRKVMTRREFLSAMAGLTLIGIGGYPFVRRWMSSQGPLSLPSPPTVAWNGNIKTFRYVIQRGPVTLQDGTRFTGYLINGQFPGPELRVQEGDKVQVTVVNQLDQPTTLHWHGVNAPSPMDGVPGISQDPVLPGQSFTYEFIASPAGTRWYHSHVYEMEQVPNGLFGPLIIEPKTTPEPYPTQHELTLMFSTWGYKPGAGIDYGMMGNTGMGQMMGGGGNLSSSNQGLTHLVNGKIPTSLQSIKVAPREKLRLRLINASGTESYLLAIDGGTMLVTHTDGNPLQAPRVVSELYIAPAERYDVIVTPPRSGTWYLRSSLAGQESVRIPFSTVGEVKSSPAVGANSWSYLITGSNSFGSLPAVNHSVQLVLSGGMMMGGAWTINGASYPNTSPVKVRTGERIRLEMVNRSMMEHPMHLHGHSFAITSFNGRVLNSPLIKDVVNLKPMERCTIDFLANNPGNWFFHCHNLQHMVGGLATVIEYKDYPLPHVDKWM
ncbi:multicopper oxidase family protein [Alicyclobacillus tolerans]|uniref:multicopper oxidase family protein n=1 Tax=Alicyclobacillus tolerans TaxID=90970 RepID=UPI001F267336|nr:multicopper oxidase family protein [Alicyclobacillus tolerans]MCF8567073.1 multicopper oxidase family protein [Alicyclobacillus tolerans]